MDDQSALSFLIHLGPRDLGIPKSTLYSVYDTVMIQPIFDSRTTITTTSSFTITYRAQALFLSLLRTRSQLFPQKLITPPSLTYLSSYCYDTIHPTNSRKVDDTHITRAHTLLPSIVSNKYHRYILGEVKREPFRSQVRKTTNEVSRSPS